MFNRAIKREKFIKIDFTGKGRSIDIRHEWEKEKVSKLIKFRLDSSLVYSSSIQINYLIRTYPRSSEETFSFILLLSEALFHESEKPWLQNAS